MGMILLDKMEMKPRWILGEGGFRTMEMAAFVAIDDGSDDGPDGGEPSLGIGLVNEDGWAKFWSMGESQALVTAWRGMQILDRLTEIWHSTIYYACLLGARDMTEMVANQACTDRRASEAEVTANRVISRAIEELRKQVPGVAELREELLQKKLPNAELDRMLAICNGAESGGLEVDVRELQREIAAGVINVTRQVKVSFGLLAFALEAKEAADGKGGPTVSDR